MEEIKTIEKPDTYSEIAVTPKALKEVKNIMSSNNIPENYALRIGVKGGGCSGLSYTLGFDNEKKDGDKVFDFDNINIYVDYKSILYLSGTTIDFSDGLNGRGFVFNNPTAKRTCGCGSSFGV
jgi:iron-sulfur cluster assembly protein